MKPLMFNRKKENILYLIQLIKYYFNKNKKPEFNKNILKDQSFFSLIKQTATLAIVNEVLKDFYNYQNSWLHNEIQKYLDFFKNHDKNNQKIINKLREASKKINITPIILKEYNYKLKLNKDKQFLRFSNDVDILISQKNIFKYDSFLSQNNFLLQSIDCHFDFQPLLSKDKNYIISKISKQLTQTRKSFILNTIKEKKKHLVYLKKYSKDNNFLEVHFYPNNYRYFKNHIPLSLLFKNTYYKNGLQFIKPEARILYDANHFFIHLRFKGILKNNLNRFMVRVNLENICDLAFNVTVEEKIDWGKLIFLAQKYHASGQIYGYLMIAKKYLEINIPTEVIKKLKKQSNFLQVRMIDKINFLSIFQNKRNIAETIYVKKYLKPK